MLFFFFNDTATTEIYTLSLHDALPISAEGTDRVVVLVATVPSLLERERVFKRSPKRRVAYEALEAVGGSAPLRHLVRRLGPSPPGLDGPVRQGLAPYAHVARPPHPFSPLSPP